MSKQQKVRFTVAEYLSMDRDASEKHEFAFGETYAMGGASARHVEIVGNIVSELRNHLRQRPCRVYSTDLRLRVDADHRYTYPDVVVVCGQPQFLDDQLDTLLNPDLIVEVLSESTRNYDRGDKFQQYRGIPSFREYLLVDQAKAHVERYSKQQDGTWSLWETDSLDHVVHLESIAVRLPVSEIYLKVEFDQAAEP
ncbi:MAG: Uma2 family endonuclease [Deltaproteobacteria bacterium]|nr:Uma2 family endonuclease [Deltaproteobacteria bacterium]MBI3067233.1 Uma2 family endonuclease [Deltaproteobacteria bacterium]